MGKEDHVSTCFPPIVETVVVEKQGIKPEVLVNRVDFGHFRIILVSGRGEKTKPSLCNAWKGKEQVKAIALPAEVRERSK